MADRLQIRINSILGGQSPLAYLSKEDQFLSSGGIDPSAPSDDGVTNLWALPSGIIRPTPAEFEGYLGTSAKPLWIQTQPKDDLLYVYDSVGSVHTLTKPGYTITGLGDLNDGGDAAGNGMAYYDNYMYFARATTIARYGPLDGTPAFTDDYWVGTLGLTALSNTSYPQDISSVPFPNHILHRHSDGRLYIADVVDNTGTLHYIQTTKTTIEGDTNNGSTYDKVNVGYGLWPTAMESYGENLVIAFYEGPFDSTAERKSRAKVAFWDTNSDNVNQITWVEYPDDYISAIKNANGVLYFISGTPGAYGFRVMRYVGGYSFEEVAKIKFSEMPMPGATDAIADQLLFGGSTDKPFDTAYLRPAIYSLGLQTGGITRGLFNIFHTNESTKVYSFCVPQENDDLGYLYPVSGIGNGGIYSMFSTSSYNNEGFWFSKMYNIGQPFKILKIRIPLVEPMSANKSFDVKLWFDSGNDSWTNVRSINNTNYSGEQNIVLRPENAVGNNNFILNIDWSLSNSVLAAIALPITIEYELIDD